MLDKMAKELTDDTIVIEAPSFIVPYIYEKPPPTDINFNDVSGKSTPKFPEMPREKSTLSNHFLRGRHLILVELGMHRKNDLDFVSINSARIFFIPL